MEIQVGVLFTQSPVGMALLDLEGRIRRANPALQGMLQQPETELLGQHLSLFLHPADAAVFVEDFRGLGEGAAGILEQDGRFFRKSGQSGWLRLTVSLLRNAAGAPRLAFAMVKDVSQWKKSERDMQNAMRQAEEVSRTKSEFLAHMSHEIRTPIHTITGMTELLQDTPLDAEQREYTGQVRFASDVLLSLVNDVLDFSKIEAGRLNLEQVDFDLRVPVGEAVDLVSLEAHRKGLELVVFIDPRTQMRRRGDPARLRQVLVNLLSNAVKFTARGEIELTGGPGDGSELRFAVRDTGIGISEQQRGTLFTPFTQADSSITRKFGGTGLGLTIARSLVELMDGRVGVDSVPGKGSTFWFTCRLDPSLAKRSVGEPELPGADLPEDALPAGSVVMIVEDNAAARRAARGYLEAWGCTVMEAAEAQAALTALRSAAAAGRPAAVALIDQRMSGMDGWQLAGEIRRDAELSATRLVLISPAGMGAVEAKMRLLGWFAAYLTKPLKPRELAAALVGGPALEEVEELAPVPDAPKAEDQVVSAAGDVRVLIAEDHAVNREMFRVVLRRCGCEVVATEDGEKALQAAGAGRFDLIFLDLQMPNLPGLEATRRLRGIGVQAPIIGMSASVLSQEREQCRAAGMNGFLAKPFGLKEVQEVLARYLPARGAAQSGAAADDPPADGVFDAAEALAACLGDREALAGLLETFLSRLAEQQAAIRAALDSGGPAAGPAWQAAARAEAHSIKGAALNLCAGELAEQAGALERLAAAGHWKQAAEMFPQLEAAARRFRERAQRHGGTL